jgi:hypothetical protein
MHRPRTAQSVSLPDDFLFNEVPPRRPLVVAQPTPSLGPLAAFTGTWVGKGFNTIFRPNNSVTPTPLPIPLAAPGDNILELNLTAETLTFSSSLGAVPNRGSTPQGDIFLNGVPYLQTVNDITDPNNPVGIHVEPGLWMRVPKTDTPTEQETVVRMASIPHGTTIQAQGTATALLGRPKIAPVSITPFKVGTTQAAPNLIPFPSQTATTDGTARIPQDLSPFVAAGAITQELLDNPNSLINNQAAAQNIVNFIVISVNTAPALPLFGGGTDNIAFLDGTTAAAAAPNTAAGQNALAFTMNAIFWIETVQITLNIPAYAVGDPPIIIDPPPTIAGLPMPTFIVKPTNAIPAAKIFTTFYQQIQYSQFVVLNFAGLSWPHVSVATLVPAEPISIEATI